MNVLTNFLGALRPSSDSDSTDRMSYCFTTSMLAVASAFVTGWSFVGSPMNCWFPAYYKGWWQEYALDYCYVANTYFVPFTTQEAENMFDFAEHIHPLADNSTTRQEKTLSYYQWVPFILALQAFAFYLPVLIWRAMYNSTGLKVQAICDVCSIASNMDAQSRKRNVGVVAGFLRQEYTLIEGLGASRRRRLPAGNSLLFMYLVTKALYAAVAVGQVLVLMRLLGDDSAFWGFDVLRDLWEGRDWKLTGNFPRVTFCDFSVRVLGNVHEHTVQCVLLINMFTEKIFLFLYFWFLFVAVCNVTSLIRWLLSSFGNGEGKRIVRSYLHKVDPARSRPRGRLEQFIADRLRADGLFLVRLVRSNSGDLVACQLVETLWNQFVEERKLSQPPPLLVQDKDKSGFDDEDEPIYDRTD